MSSNKGVKEEMIRRYGAKCFIERLHLRDTKGQKYKGKGQYKRMKQLTFHHIRMKSKGGKATVENGALLSTENHAWFHQQSRSDQAVMNNMFQELKRNIDNGLTEEIPVAIVPEEEIEQPFEIDVAVIEADKKGIKVKAKARKKSNRKKRRTRKRKPYQSGRNGEER